MSRDAEVERKPLASIIAIGIGRESGVSKIHKLPSRSEPVKGIVDLFEEFLAKAKSGKIEGVGIVIVERGPVVFETAFHSDGNKHALAAGIAALQWKIGQRLAEGT